MADKSLTESERITCAYMHYVRGIQQQDLAAIYDVNQARVNEACKAIKTAADDPLRFVQERKALKAVNE
jgi:hypothetical protein